MNFRGAWISAYETDMGNKACWQTAPPLSFLLFSVLCGFHCLPPQVCRQDGECLTPSSSRFPCAPVNLKAGGAEGLQLPALPII